MNRFIRIIIFLIAIGCHFPDANAGHAKNDTISILSFNDFHGAFISGQGTPGAGNFVAALLELKQQVPNPVVLSGGDNFSGSYFSLMTQVEPHRVFTLPAAPDTLVSAVGNHEFDWGTDYLLNTSSLCIRYVGANIKSHSRAATFYKDSGETGVESKIEDWKTGGSISGEATMQ